MAGDQDYQIHQRPQAGYWLAVAFALAGTGSLIAGFVTLQGIVTPSRMDVLRGVDGIAHLVQREEGILYLAGGFSAYVLAFGFYMAGQGLHLLYDIRARLPATGAALEGGEHSQPQTKTPKPIRTAASDGSDLLMRMDAEAAAREAETASGGMSAVKQVLNDAADLERHYGSGASQPRETAPTPEPKPGRKEPRL